MKLNEIVSEDTAVYEEGTSIYIVRYPLNEFIQLEWQPNDFVGGILTLKEIEEQVRGITGKDHNLIRVIDDSGLGGIIYEYGNYHDKKWRVYGFTKGYA